MALAPADELPFDEATPDAVLDVLDALEPGQWVNLLPRVEAGLEPAPRGLVVSLFSSRGDDVPLVTWSAPEVPGGRLTLGLTHGSGPKALARLADNGLELPAGWLKLNDHPRRGLVVTAPDGASSEDVLSWLLSAAHALSNVPLTGSWLARRYAP